MSNMFSAAEYRTAAEVLEYDDPTNPRVGAYRDKADRLEEREAAINALGNIATQYPTSTPHFIGSRVIDHLLHNGWTPPKFMGADQ